LSALQRVDPAGRLASEGLRPQRWSNGPGDQYQPHRHDYDKVLVPDRGSITFTLPELSRAVDLRAGDRLELPAGTLHAASVGPDGVDCLEAHLPVGSLTKVQVQDNWATGGTVGRSETAGAGGA
jgi:quercetin dioxygenase-like cupin family protein